MSLSAHIKAFGLSKALDYLERDPDANLPRLMEWLERFDGEKLPSRYMELIHQALSDPDNNWYRLIKSMYTDIDSRVLKKLFENFIIYGVLLEWPQQYAGGAWAGGAAPWAVLIDPSIACAMDCEGCGAAVYGVRPEMEFDTLDEAVDAHKAGGTHLFIFSGGDPLAQEQGMIALCNKHTDCVFAAFTPPASITEELADDMLRVRNLFPAIRADVDSAEAERAMALLRRKKLPFGIACRCTAENVELAGSEAAYDEVIRMGAKFCWFFTCPAYGPERPASLGQLQTLHRKIKEFRKTKPLLTLDFWDGPSPVCVARDD